MLDMVFQPGGYREEFFVVLMVQLSFLCKLIVFLKANSVTDTESLLKLNLK